jgi:hypothetical protein
MDNWFKRNGVHFLITALFLLLCFFYLTPAFQGKTLGQNDVTRAQSTQTEINAYKDKGVTILWTNQIHGGMPAFQIWAPYTDNLTTWIVKGITAIFPSSVGTLFLMLSGAYLLFCVMNINPWLSVAAAIAFTFSSYNIILLVAGHANQAFAIAFFAPVIAGILLAFRGRYITGTAITAFFLAMEIRANHIQMTYYLLIVILVLVIIELYHALKNKTFKPYFTAIAWLAAATMLAVAVNASSLWSTYEYGKDTIRGKSNLTQHIAEPSTGLPRTYAYEWSQGVEECITFMIPNAYGGSSRGSTKADTQVMKKLSEIGADPQQAAYISESALPLYWGEKPFTEGSFYFGAIVCFLFVAGLMIVNSKLKWWLLSAVILTMLLSFGRNWPYISDLFFNYAPLYNKFRAVESILAVTALCVPMLAFLAAQEILINRDQAMLLKKLKIAFYITGGLTLLISVAPGILLSFKSSTHEALIGQLAQGLKIDASLANTLVSALLEDRAALAQADALRSLIFIALAFALIWSFLKNKVNATVLSAGLLVLILVDLWSVDKRYLNSASFVKKQNSVVPQMREVDTQILQDKDPDYRVMDLSQNIKSDLVTPYFHKSLGGYSAARLKRFEELIDNQLSNKLNLEVLNMLNTRYVIVSDPKTQALTVQQNPAACGNAWFVNKIRLVKNADQEMEGLSQFSAKTEALAEEKYKNLITVVPSRDTTASIRLSSYAPDHLQYQSSSSTPQLAVFSEIYYDKGWTMQIDGVEHPYFRADYLLRAASVPAGKHTISFDFHPASYYTGEKISLAGSILLVLVIGGAAAAEIRGKKKKA